MIAPQQSSEERQSKLFDRRYRKTGFLHENFSYLDSLHIRYFMLYEYHIMHVRKSELKYPSY